MKMNRQLVVALVAVAGAWCWQGAAQAATQESGRPGGARAAQWRVRIEEGAKELNLTDEQKAKLKAILQPQTEKFRQLRQDNTLTRWEKLEKFKTMREELAPQIKEVLTPEQYAKWEQTRGQWFEKARDRWQQRRQQ